MDAIQAAVLGLVQGLTEFLPVSSSGHLVLAPWLLGWEDQSLAFDVAVHMGTLLAVVAYFWRDLFSLVPAVPRIVTGAQDDHTRLARGLLIATLPACILGAALRIAFDIEFDSPALVAANLIIFGLLLGAADRWGRRNKRLNGLSMSGYVLLGLAQAMALIPGTSRSGATMTAGLALGLDRVDAARVSFLMAVPVIAIAGGYELLKLLTSDAAVDWMIMGIGVAVAFISGLLCIAGLLRFLAQVGFWPFVIYRLLLGGAILVVVV